MPSKDLLDHQGLATIVIPKFPGVSEVAAPGYHVPEELLIFPEVDLDAYVAGEPVNPEDRRKRA
ncbi:hypothetical protein KP79_PYT16532 [Mizuhopecten yessoensis]|uniref:Uncharacterized protein n=1 Tax=Mizuhopecten yessoensis TaxID=6573 RepID=A0A210PTD7_MIZYE|nr:hypothetical protein KP79_PYT16532 [Mizuhopecten yessoensis]